MRKYLPVAAFVLVGCVSYKPPVQQAARPEMTVNASFGRTWDAVIDYYAERNITITTIERASGIIVAAPSFIADKYSDRVKFADCGTIVGYGPVDPSRVVYNVRVKGDSSATQMRVNADWGGTYQKNQSYKCVSKGLFESQMEAAIRAKAERR